MTKLIFTAKGTFEALYRAQGYLRRNGFSYGSSCGSKPVGILKGDFAIAKWHNLRPKDIQALDGTMTGELREGPITVEIKSKYKENFTQAQVEAEFDGYQVAAKKRAKAVAVFEAMGFIPGIEPEFPNRQMWTNGDRQYYTFADLPELTLDVIHEAICSVITTDDLMRDFHNNLHFVCLSSNPDAKTCNEGRRMFFRENATVDQRIEAFLGTIGKLEGSE